MDKSGAGGNSFITAPHGHHELVPLCWIWRTTLFRSLLPKSNRQPPPEAEVIARTMVQAYFGASFPRAFVASANAFGNGRSGLLPSANCVPSIVVAYPVSSRRKNAKSAGRIVFTGGVEQPLSDRIMIGKAASPNSVSGDTAQLDNAGSEKNRAS